VSAATALSYDRVMAHIVAPPKRTCKQCGQGGQVIFRRCPKCGRRYLGSKTHGVVH
jgi:primosomal protein N'